MFHQVPGPRTAQWLNGSINVPELASNMTTIPFRGLHYGGGAAPSNNFTMGNQGNRRAPAISSAQGPYVIHDYQYKNNGGTHFGVINTLGHPSSDTYAQNYSASGFSKQLPNNTFTFNNKPDASKRNNFISNKAYTQVSVFKPAPIPQNEAYPRVDSSANYSKTVRAGYMTQPPETENLATATQDIGKAATSKKNVNEKIRLFTGTAERIIKWHKVYNDYFCYYEVIAAIVSIQEGTVRLQKIMLLRDRKGPIIQVVHYINDHIKIENFCVGQMLRCVGRMVGPNTMHGLSIREATPDEVTTLQRMCYISDHAITKALTKS